MSAARHSNARAEQLLARNSILHARLVTASPSQAPIIRAEIERLRRIGIALENAARPACGLEPMGADQ